MQYEINPRPWFVRFRRTDRTWEEVHTATLREAQELFKLFSFNFPDTTVIGYEIERNDWYME